MSQPTEKRAADLKIGDYIHDGRGIGPVEVTHTQRHRNVHGEQRVLLVTGDAAVSYHCPTDVFPVATAAEMADAEQRRDRARVIADIRALADWYEQRPNLPAPLTVDVRINVNDAKLSNAERRAAVAAVAAAMGVEVEERDKTVSAKYVISNFEPARVEVVTHVWLADEAAVVEPQPEPGAEVDQTLPHYEARGWKGVGPEGGCGVECACGVTYDGFDSLAEAAALLTKHVEEGNAVAAKMLETPLDELPDDFGADHVPTPDCCEDCEWEVDADAADAAHEEGLRRAGEHLAYNPATERHETGGDEIEFADEADS